MNLFRKAVASITLAALVVSTGASSVSAYSPEALTAANGLAAANVINDNSANTAGYNLDSLLTRAESAKIAVNLDDTVSMKTTCDNSFADVTATTPNTWVCGYAEALLDAGKVSANTNFNPNSNLTKSEATKMFLEAAGCTDVYTNVATWQAETVAYASANGIVDSFSDYNTPATRGFVFGVAYNAMNSCPIEEVACDSVMEALGICTVEDTTTDTDNTDTTDNTDNTDTTTNEGASVKLSAETPVDGTVAANTPRTALIAFDVKAGDSDLTLDEVSLKYTGLSDSSNIEQLSVYLGNDKVSKGSNKKFDSDNERDLSFEKNTIIKAGETKTLFVTATLSGSTVDTTNASYQVTVTNVKTKSGDLAGTPLVGATLSPVSVTNVAALELTEDTASETVTVGEEVKLAGFNLEETTNKEDVNLKSVTITVSGSVDTDDIANLKLLADGQVIADNLTINSDDEIIADLDFTIPADEKVEFELKGSVTGSVGDTIEMVFETPTEDIYAIGVNHGIVTAITDTSSDIADAETIEGSEINVSFDKSDIDEAKPDADKVEVGTLKISTDSADYTVNKLKVTVENTTAGGTGVLNVVKDLELDGSSFDTTDTNSVSATTVEYTFEDIDLINGELSLPLTFDVEDDTALNGSDLEFTVSFVEIEDTDQDKTYTTSSTPDLNSILSSNSFDSKTVSIETATFDIVATEVNERDLVLGNGIETVVYKAKINVGDADSVKIKDFKLKENSSNSLSNSADLKDIIDTATLNIGGQTFDADVNASDIKFTGINAEIAAGSDNVEVLVTVVLKDSDKIANGDKLALEAVLVSSDVEDSAGDDLEGSNFDATDINSHLAVTNLLDKGTFAIEILNEADTDDNLENTVLAGSSNVTLAEIEMEAEYEDAKVKEIAFDFGYGDFSNTLTNVKLVNVDNNSTIVDGGIVTLDNNNHTIVTFKNDFVVADADNLISAEVVSDLNRITGEGGATSAKSGTIKLEKITADQTDIKGVQSNDELTSGGDLSTVAAEEVTIVPTILNFAVVESLSNGTAKIKITADSGDNTVGTNDQIPEVLLTAFTPTDLATGTDYKIYKDGNAAGQQTSFTSLSAADRTFDDSVTYVFVPQTTDGTKSYTMVLSGNVATYDVKDSAGTSVATGLNSVLNSDINVGTKSY